MACASICDSVYMDRIGDFINRQKWLAPVEAVLGVVANTTFNKLMPLGQQVRNFLHGTWLGHPLHPVITDVPIGAWTAAAVLDTYELATDDDTFAPGADIAVGVGLIGAAGAAVCGLNDWNATSGKPKRVGAVHALCQSHRYRVLHRLLVSTTQRRPASRPNQRAHRLCPEFHRRLARRTSCLP